MKQGKLTVELDGPGLEAESADPLVVLPFATAYFKALERVAELRLGEPLELHGLRIVDKCVGVETEGHRMIVQRVVDLLDQALLDPFERDESVRALRRERKSLPGEVTASVFVDGKRRHEITSIEGHKGKVVELVDFQANVLRAGGKPPTVELIDRTNIRTPRVSLSGSVEIIKDISKHLFGIVNVVAEVSTDQMTDRRTGKLVRFEPVPDVDPVTAWREWFARNAPEWNDVDDVEAELGR